MNHTIHEEQETLPVETVVEQNSNGVTVINLMMNNVRSHHDSSARLRVDENDPNMIMSMMPPNELDINSDTMNRDSGKFHPESGSSHK